MTCDGSRFERVAWYPLSVPKDVLYPTTAKSIFSKDVDLNSRATVASGPSPKQPSLLWPQKSATIEAGE